MKDSSDILEYSFDEKDDLEKKRILINEWNKLVTKNQKGKWNNIKQNLSNMYKPFGITGIIV